MTAALFVLAAVAIAAVAAAVLIVRAQIGLAGRVLASLDATREERQMLYRALVARGGVELAQMERAAVKIEKPDPRRPVTPDDIEADLQRFIGSEAARTIVKEAGLSLADVPARPEGL